MKRNIFTLLILTSLLALAACAGKADSPVASTLSVTSDSIGLAYDPEGGGLLRADNQGLSRWRAGGGWETMALPEASGLSGVVVNPDRPGTVYVSGAGVGVLRSEDAGERWKEVNAGLPDLEVTALALHSFRRETLYAWVRGEGIYRTEDGGVTWVRVPDQGPPDSEVRGMTHSTLPGSMNTGWLYASTPTGAYLSMDCF
ncbi:MAG TPA: hypothetical protein VI524_08860 [Anaerolineales bacterium]|nr:hypothetical protein [Anaerolineales bacterium]